MFKAVRMLFVAAMLMCSAVAFSKPRVIKKVAPVAVSCPVGTVPRLPNRLWVTYSDGYAEYRQVKWLNAPLSTEQAEADSTLHPAGSSYALAGYIVGDLTTDNGYPVTAKIDVVDKGYEVPFREVAFTFPLGDVTINGDNRLTHNRDEALREICSWDVTQQLYNYRDTYGMSTDGYTLSDGWDSPDTKLKGHGSGHYMSAIVQAYAVTRDPQQKETLRRNITCMVNELRACQEKTFVYNDSLGRYWEARDFAPEAELKDMKGTWAAFDQYKRHPERYGYGYLNAIPAQHCALIEMYRPYNNSDWVWAPYYSVHKQLAGLIDIATYFDDKAIADKALLTAKDMGLWVWNRMHYRTFVKADGTQAERRAKPGNRYEMWDMYIAGEVGGMQESLSRLAAMVSDEGDRAKLLEAAQCFDAPKFYEPLSRNIDDIRTRHANQHIPMIIGALRFYNASHDNHYYNIAENFFTLVQGRYMYATGGVGNGEMFRQPYTQVLSMATNGMREGETVANPDLNETCCTYNLLKLAKDLNAFRPDCAAYMDYYERGLYNQIVGSLNPDRYQTTYQYAVGLNATKPFGNETPQSTCCGGTGSENHTKYQQAAYFHNDSTLWVCLYMPTTLSWRQKGMTIVQDCQWPAQRSAITITAGEGDFAMKLRVPYWATRGFKVMLNGKAVAKHFQPSSYVTIPRRHWTTADKVEIVMPFAVHIEYGPDKLPAEVANADSSRYLEATAAAGTPLKSAWTGVLMYGPLCMTGTGATTWRDATLTLDSRLSNVKVAPVGRAVSQVPCVAVYGNSSAPVGRAVPLVPCVAVYGNGSAPALFEPDYYRNTASTHYYRLAFSDVTAKHSGSSVAPDLTELQSLLSIAKEREGEQKRWQAASATGFAPWAPNGFKRLTDVMAATQRLLAKDKQHLTADSLEAATAALSKAINTMRPGNLAEVEDLVPLTALLQQVDSLESRNVGVSSDALGVAASSDTHRAASSSDALRSAVAYANMVVRYVTDGSGTTDMIRTALARLRAVLPTRQ